MAEVKEDNPVGILYHLLVKSLIENQDLATKDVWGAVFSVSSPHELLEHFLEFKILTERVKKILSDLEDSEFYLEGFKGIEELLNIFSLNNRWGSIKGAITPQVLVRLEGAARIVSRKSPNPEEEIATLQADIESLTERALKSDSLDTELKNFIVQNLEILRRGLVAYRIGGIEQLQKAFSEVTGSLFLNTNRIDKCKDTEELGEFGKIYFKVFDLLKKYQPLISYTADVLQIATAVLMYQGK